MPTLPDPLHPAVVHFPIVFILLGTGVAVAAAIWWKWNLPWIAAGLLLLGAAGTIVAVNTGESEGEMAGEASAVVDGLLDQHETWAERTQIFAIVAAVVALAAAVAVRWPKVRRLIAPLSAAGALAASWCVFETGHRGGRLVYQHGVGILTVAPGAGGDAATRPVAGSVRHHDDD